MELNYILCWFVGASAGLGLYRTYTATGLHNKGWLIKYVACLLTLGVGLSLKPDVAGFVAGGVWAVLILAPLAADRAIERLFARRKLGAARAVAQLVAILHPADGLRQQPVYFRALEQIQSGDLDGARRSLERLGGSETEVSRFVTLQMLRAEGRWEELARWVEDHVGYGPQLFMEGNTLALYVRALGETGRVAEVLHRFAEARAIGLPPQITNHLALAAVAYAGRPGAVEQLFAGPLAVSSPSTRAFFLATARQVAGETEEAGRAFAELAEQGDDAIVRRAAARRLEKPLARLDERTLGGVEREILARIERDIADGVRYGVAGITQTAPSLVTGSIVALNLGAFAVELRGGESIGLASTTDLENLVGLGALVVPTELVGDVWHWRVIAAGFLHFGPLHLLLNMAALWILGRHVERVWGRLRMLLVYASAVIGGNLVAIALSSATPDNPMVMVGASGGVMGVLGAAVAFVAMEWRRRKIALLRRQLNTFGVILLLQVTFDSFTPEVSSTVHLAGLAIGVGLGIVLALTDRRDDDPTTDPARQTGDNDDSAAK